MEQEFSSALIALIEGNDPKVYLGLLSDGATFWHNDDRVNVLASEMPGNVGIFHEVADSIEVSIIETLRHGDVLAVRFRIVGILSRSGENFDAYPCLFVRFANGKVRHIDEYVDPGIAALVETEINSLPKPNPHY